MVGVHRVAAFLLQLLMFGCGCLLARSKERHRARAVSDYLRELLAERLGRWMLHLGFLCEYIFFLAPSIPRAKREKQTTAPKDGRWLGK
jgi:hypothetical protein